MRNFLLKIGLFSALLIVLGIIFGLLADHGLRSLRKGEFGEWNRYRTDSIHSNWIILGNSRAYRHFSTQIIDSILRVDSYNLGATNATFPFQRLRYNYYRRFADKPSVVILSVDAGTTLHTEDGIPDRQQFIPILNEPEIQKGLKGYKNGFQWFDYYNPVTKYNRCFEAMKQGLFSFIGIPESGVERYKGFINENYKWDGTFEQCKAQYPMGKKMPVDKNVIEDLTSFLRQTAGEGIRVVMVYSPEYIEGQQLILNRDSIVKIYRDISNKMSVPFLDYSSHPICYDKSCFYNSTHLTLDGAEQFSKIVCSDLKLMGNEYSR
jgi:hypothetical protein